jgi:hypothetical protein
VRSVGDPGFQSSPLIAEGRYCRHFIAAVFKHLDALFREMNISLPEQSIFAPTTSLNCLILFTRETPSIFIIAPGSR